MIITRTPFRVSFAGGGTDIKDFYLRHGYGAVVSAAIQQYMYIVIHPYFHDKIRIKYSKTEDVLSAEEVKHPIVRECLKKVGIETGVEIASFADVASGTGLGSSSAFTVGLLNALYAYKGRIISKHQLAEDACEIEIDILKEPIGKQDQFASAYGNINYIRFNKDETVDVSPILLSEYTKAELENSLCLYYVGGTRDAKDILSNQRENLLNNYDKFIHLKNMFSLAENLRDIFINYNNEKKSSISWHIGDILKKGWSFKKELADCISNANIDSIYDNAFNVGAKGGKLLGAGGAGFLLFCHDNHKLLSSILGIKTLPFKIDREGTKVIFYN